MKFNLNTYEIDNITLGQKTDLSNSLHSKGAYHFFVENNQIKSISVRLGQFYSKGPVFDGQIQINEKLIHSNNKFLPQVILSEFENETSSWDDGVEINHQFIVGNIELKFSWRSGTLEPNYIIIQVQ